MRVEEPLFSRGGAALERSEILSVGRIVGQETAVIQSDGVNIPTGELIAEIFAHHPAGPQRQVVPIMLMNQPHTGAPNQSLRKNFMPVEDNLIRPPYYVSSNVFTSRIAIFAATIEGSYEVQLWDSKTLTTIWERQVVREELTWMQQYPSFSLDGSYVGFYIAGYIQVLETVTGREFQSVWVWTSGIAAFAVGPNGRVAVASTYNYKREPDIVRNGPAFDNVVLTPREQVPRIFYTRDGKQIFIIFIDSGTNTGIGVRTVRVDLLTIESGNRKPLFKANKASSYEAHGTIMLDDKDCIVLDIKFSDPERSEYGDRWERRVVAVSTSKDIRDLRLFTKDQGNGVVIAQGGVISVGLHGSVKKYVKSGPSVLAEWKASTEFKHSRVIACDEERLTVLSPEGHLQVFELARLNGSRRVQTYRTAMDDVLEQFRAAQI